MAEVRSPVRHQAIERTIRPPSIGNAGSRLKTSTRALIEASQAIAASAPEVPASRSSTIALRNSPEPPIARPTRPRTATIARVTTGPPIATLNSVEGLSDSRSIWATPPKIQSWMLVMPIPLRIATKAWPSSWRTIEAKKPKALTSASRNGAVAELSSSRTFPNSLESQKMTRKRTRNHDQSTEIGIPRTRNRVIGLPPST